MAGFPGLTNHVVAVPGTNVTCYMGVWDKAPTVWIYTLWEDPDNDDGGTCLASGELDIPQPDSYTITPDQIARIAFLLECEYVDTPTAGPW